MKSSFNSAELSRRSGALVEVYDTLPSTNTLAKELAAKGAPHATAIVSRHQSAGRGRLGRSFCSAGEGIYLSVILRTQEDFSHTPLITAAAAVAVREAVLEVCRKECKIKWVNDLLLGGKKVCGILTEAVTNPQSGKIDAVVVGVGINFCGKTDDLPEELRPIAGFVLESGGDITALTARVIEKLVLAGGQLEKKAFLESYRSASSVIGERVEFVRNGEKTEALAVGIDDSCALRVLTDGGEHILLSAGEISVRKLTIDNKR